MSKAQARINWLHLTDLHCGQQHAEWVWPGVRSHFFEDISRLHDLCGPWDIVFFTGDLTQSGQRNQFEAATEHLGSIWHCLEGLGSRPALLAVPGNHDLTRPDPLKPEVVALRNWKDNPELQVDFWANDQSPYRRLVEDIFENYMRWSDLDAPRPSLEYRSGLLPGDFAATFEVQGASLGVVGLNSTFLQLTAGDFTRKLFVHAQQITKACGGGGLPEFTAGHDFCVLLTHHPPSWLAPDAEQHLNGEIAPPGRFALHLFGHMHESVFTRFSSGGASLRRLLQGTSLCGLEFWGEDSRFVRSHGYSAGRLEISEGHGDLRLWPRRLLRHQEGHWEFVPDHEAFSLRGEDNLSTESEPLGRVETNSSSGAGKQQRVGTSPSAFTGGEGESLSELVDRHDRVLRQLGREILTFLCARPDPSEPLDLPFLLAGLRAAGSSLVHDLSTIQLGRLISDVQSRGFAPGLARTRDGFLVAEDHIAFKVTREMEAKELIARAAVSFIEDHMRIAIDGGSTTLPVAKRIVNLLERERVTGLTILTNSIPVVEVVSTFIETRGHSDDDTPIRVIVGAGLVRPNTKAIAELKIDRGETHRSIGALLETLGGVDLCFVGANGLTVREGITMPTAFELLQKKQFLEAAGRSFIVADASKFGQHFQVRIAEWTDANSVITNRPPEPNAEMEAILGMEGKCTEVLLAEEVLGD